MTHESKCPFDDPDVDIGVDDPCPVCGITGHDFPWNGCVRFVSDDEGLNK